MHSHGVLSTFRFFIFLKGKSILPESEAKLASPQNIENHYPEHTFLVPESQSLIPKSCPEASWDAPERLETCRFVSS